MKVHGILLIGALVLLGVMIWQHHGGQAMWLDRSNSQTGAWPGAGPGVAVTPDLLG